MCIQTRVAQRSVDRLDLPIVGTQGAIDVILSDMRLAEADSGIEAIAQVHRLQPDARAVLVTGDTAPERLREAQDTALPLLHKPVTLANLLDVLGA